MSKGMLFQKGDGCLFKLDQAVVTVMQRYMQRAADDLEAGGVLMGRRLRGQPHLIVDELTTPMLGDRRRRTRFSRGYETHQRILDEKWQQSGGTCGYLGEWHTHPEPVPAPSATDLRNWRRHLLDDVFDGDYLYFIIIGTEEIRAWEGRCSDRHITLLAQILTD